MLDHQSWISIPTKEARGQYLSVQLSHTYWLMMPLMLWIQISIALIGMVKKPSVEPIALAKRWGITPQKNQKTIQVKMQRDIKTMIDPLLL